MDKQVNCYMTSFEEVDFSRTLVAARAFGDN